MDPAEALADLTEICGQIEQAVIADEAGEPLAATLPDEDARALAGAAREIAGRAGAAVLRIEAATTAGSLFVVRNDRQLLVATTGVRPSSGLVLYDLAACLRTLEEQPNPRRRRTTRKKRDDAEG